MDDLNHIDSVESSDEQLARAQRSIVIAINELHNLIVAANVLSHHLIIAANVLSHLAALKAVSDMPLSRMN